MLIASEAGELLAEYRSVPNTASDAHSAAPDSRARIAAKMTTMPGDVGIALTLLCDRIGVDLCAAMSDKLAQNRLRYPPDKARGKATRPDDA